ncbi:hypothetical protein J3458_019353 [Metarhizium acridum]|uniref:uncharacterized protein n=1 Tax=Metarhizium acridum TaxID=92637 RepID=UPI001C6AA509|nr:hypothetical protein J3458_019353 [Metarhizium acridum]
MEDQGERSIIEVQLLLGEATRIPSPVELAAKNGHLGTMTELRSCGLYNNTLATACREGKDDCALYILQWYDEVYSAGEHCGI